MKEEEAVVVEDAVEVVIVEEEAVVVQEVVVDEVEVEVIEGLINDYERQEFFNDFYFSKSVIFKFKPKDCQFMITI